MPNGRGQAWRYSKEKRDRIRGMLKRGLSNKEIMQQVNLSSSGLAVYVAELMREYGLYGPGDHRRLMVCLLTEGK